MVGTRAPETVDPVRRTFELLEFDRVRELLAARTGTAFGRSLALDIAPLRDRRQVEAALDEVDQARVQLDEVGDGPLRGGEDIEPLLFAAQAEDALLDPADLLRVAKALDLARQVRSWLRAELAPGLFEQSRELDPLPGLAGALSESLGPRGEVLDSASWELAEIRSRLRELREHVRRRLEQMLQDENLAPAFQERIITLRGDRYVVPVRADRRSMVRGFVHDTSGSGQTLFVEPAAVLEANNELVQLLRAEQREIRQILLRLSAAVRRCTSPLRHNQRILARIDLRLAAARLARDMDACRPRFAEHCEIDLRQCRHPLLMFDREDRPVAGRAVPVDLKLAESTRLLVISGPNTGGKTVTLKCFGLLQLMLASGLQIPCHPDSRTWLFAEVLADIGDDQSIEAGLSTFSAHLLRLRQILERAGDQTLVLLDEIGTGTDPAEGSALALALLEELCGRGTRVVATTHLHRVKAFAQMREDAANAAVAFDPEDFRPLYRLDYGTPGASGALAIAAGLGFPASVLDRARDYVDPAEQRGRDLLEELNSALLRAREQAARAEEELRRARQEREKRTRLLHQFEQQREELMERARREARALVKRAERDLRALKLKAEDSLTTPQQAELGAGLRQVEQALRPKPARRPGRTLRRVAVGDRVCHRLLGQEGEVVRVDGEQVEIVVAGKRLQARLADLEAARENRSRPDRVRISGRRLEQPGPERLVLVGRRVDDALPEVERFLDRALLAGRRQVEIVHGSGEGILRRAVREFLGGHRAVTAFYAADLAHGGDNVTVVELEG
ncbi:MAG: endonuclease MutS2 [Geothermobacteraceae bacterium]